VELVEKFPADRGGRSLHGDRGPFAADCSLYPTTEELGTDLRDSQDLVLGELKYAENDPEMPPTSRLKDSFPVVRLLHRISEAVPPVRRWSEAPGSHAESTGVRSLLPGTDIL
jgi:hypothetical protein